jgi:hypothetical protein
VENPACRHRNLGRTRTDSTTNSLAADTMNKVII